MKDVAIESGVSSATVSHVINKTRFVSDEVIKKVDNAIKKLNYTPNPIARCLRRKETKTIGVIISTNSNPYFSELIQGIEEACFNNDYSVVVCYSNYNKKNELQNIKKLLEREVDGIILNSIALEKDISDILNKLDIPIVMINRYIEGLDIDFIHTDDFKGGYIATEYLIKLGHKKIACVTAEAYETSHSYYQRYFGYEKALKDHDIGINEEYIIYEKHFSLQEGFESLKKLISLKNPPTAITYIGDLMAIGALSSLYKLRLKAPEDISIIGYDNAEIAKYTIPPLTTINHEKYKLGIKSVNRIINKINNPEQKIEHIIIAPELIERESCKKI